MKAPVRTVLYVLLAALCLLTFYGIFNAGNPNSLFRLVVPDPAYDVAVTVGLGVAVGALVVALTASRQNSLTNLLDLNRRYILELRAKGRTDEQIAESFLEELGSRAGVLHTLAKRRVLRYLSKLS